MSAIVDVKEYHKVDIERLWKQYATQRTDALKDQLFSIYQPYATKISLSFYKRYADTGVCLDDLKQAAYVGLLEAIERFDSARGALFEYFAGYRIKGGILNSLKNYSEASQVYQYRKKLEQERLDSISQTLDSNHGVKEVINVVLDVISIALIEEEAETLLQNNIEQSEIEDGIYVGRLMERMPDDLQQVLSMHYFEERSFSEIGRKLKISKSAVYHMHRKALKSLRQQLQEVGKSVVTV